MNFILLQVIISFTFDSKFVHGSTSTPYLTQTHSKLKSRDEISVSIPYKGVAVNSTLLKIDSEYRKIIEEGFEVLTPENAMKWELTEKVRGVFTFEDADEIVNYASEHNKRSRGHTIIWQQQVPSWLPELDPEELIKAIQDHLKALLHHYKGRLYAIDICNEIIEEDGSFKNTFWYQKLNKTFPRIALKTARELDPTVKLYINDYSIEAINKKSDGLYQLAKELKEQGLLDGIGFQSHFTVGGVPKDMQENLERFAALDLDVAITELDIRMKLPSSNEDINQQAQDYSNVVKICRSIARCVGITLWGVSYQNSWIPSFFPGTGAALLYDENYKPTKAFEAFSSAFMS
ncbi:family 10 glycoside hydrolase [Melampsora larici-populina 98AG31]|uniref:Beta-xylanase n=1 Tax=Melampsora larici-populina (strain 98AG31 / pathotype 3-4-7) TaxID=747676 RepID=F4S1T6_MELLP|nr:family 10 glycoside hydrolase [Melampsora larici-populina 98AG31]EGG01430.1 family 10 glycoside hydrolase [Melampsora larici-populina 98AG31]